MKIFRRAFHFFSVFQHSLRFYKTYSLPTRIRCAFGMAAGLSSISLAACQAAHLEENMNDRPDLIALRPSANDYEKMEIPSDSPFLKNHALHETLDG
mmetsp:Transcript_2642/g.2797  ORF Transcript_2642/g.2797 Transcript_2642/m.2797 type:complete len:97 (+) Transcript_2642:122-412(+)